MSKFRILATLLLVSLAILGALYFLYPLMEKEDVLHNPEITPPVSLEDYSGETPQDTEVTDDSEKKKNNGISDFIKKLEEKINEQPVNTGTEMPKVPDTLVNDELLHSHVFEYTGQRNERLKGYDLVFIGDSIFAQADPDSSIPYVAGSITSADYYNMSIKGICATSGFGTNNMQMVVNCFLNGKTLEDDELGFFNSEVLRYAAEDHTGKKLIVVMNCLLNDYFNGAVIEKEGEDDSYKAALTNCIKYIRGVYPEALLVMMTPTYFSGFDQGNFQNGAGLVCEDYRKAMIETCEQNSVYCVDMLQMLDYSINNREMFFEDDVHHNPLGRQMVGETIANYVCYLCDNLGY